MNFIQACQTGNINYLQTNFSSQKKDFSTQHFFDLSLGFIRKAFNLELSSDEINEGIKKACENKNHNILKFLIKSPFSKNKIDFHYQNDIFFRTACANGDIETIKILNENTDITQRPNFHAKEDYGFRWAAKENHLEVIEFLIFEARIQKTKDIEQYLKDNPNKEIERMFQKRVRDSINLSSMISISKTKTPTTITSKNIS